MTTKKKYLWLGVSASLIVGCLIVFGVRWNTNPTLPGNRITSENCDQIQLGMTESQVESILGKPADHQYHPWDVFVFLEAAPGTNPEWEKMWIGQKKVMIFVHFDANGKVCNKGFSLPWE